METASGEGRLLHMDELDALRRENAALREANAHLRCEAALAREGQAASLQHVRSLMALVEKYSRQMHVDATPQERDAVAAIADSVGANAAPPPSAHSYDASPQSQQPLAVTPARNATFDTSFASQTGVTPQVTYQFVHDSPANGAYTSTSVALPIPQTPERAGAGGGGGGYPTKPQRKALLAGDAWAPKGSPFDPVLVVGVPIPRFPPTVKVEPMLLGGRVYKVTRSLGGENTEVSFFNGTRDMQFTLDYTFLEGSLLSPGDDGVVVGERGLSFSLTVYPGQCKVLVSGRLNGYSMHMRYGYASAACLEFFQMDGKMDAALAAASGKVRSLCHATSPAPMGSASVADLCALGGVRFVDPEFPPSQTSISRLFEPASTARPWLCLPDGVAFPSPRLEPQDLDPGLLGDAWLLSAFAAAAESPLFVTAAFTPPTAPSTTTPAQDQRAGVHRIRLCRGGWWETFIVDEWLPASPLGPAFARSLSSAECLWPSLLQKAYAKMYGSYTALKGPGDPLHALTDLTGCGCDYFNWRAPEDAFERIRDAVAGGYVVVVTAPGVEPAAAGEAGGQEEALSKSYLQVGLVSGYSYRVVGVMDEYIVVRNAWGDCERWNGDYDAAAGTINVHRDDMGSLFDSGGVAYVKPGQLSFRVQVGFAAPHGPDLMVAVEVAKECMAVITLHRNDTRGAEPAPDGENVAYCVSVVQRDDEGYGLVAASHNGTYWKGRDTVLRLALQPSPYPYYVLPRCFDEAHTASATLSFAFEGPCEGSVARFLKPTPNTIESLAFDPLFNFDPSRCSLVRPEVQTGRGDAAPSQSVSLTPGAALYLGLHP